MTSPKIGTREEWTRARLELLAREKDLNRLRDEIAVQRRALPWVPVEKTYHFEGAGGPASLDDLFDGHSQLLVYHFMYGPDWDEGCPSCSFWADGYNGVDVHLAARDVGFAVVSRAPYPKLAAYEKRMGWQFRWFSSAGSDFNFDLGVSFTPEQQVNGADYNFVHVDHPMDESPGVSAFVRENGVIFHSYSSYSRGLDPFNVAYQLLDLTARGRDEGGLEWSMQWLRRHDAY